MSARGEENGCLPWDPAVEGAEEAAPEKKLTETLEKLLGSTLGLKRRSGKGGKGGSGAVVYDLSVDVEEGDDLAALRLQRYNLELAYPHSHTPSYTLSYTHTHTHTHTHTGTIMSLRTRFVH
jgi:hypothetical protein